MNRNDQTRLTFADNSSKFWRLNVSNRSTDFGDAFAFGELHARQCDEYGRVKLTLPWLYLSCSIARVPSQLKHAFLSASYALLGGASDRDRIGLTAKVQGRARVLLLYI
jgi:hypothetical protein